MSGAGRVFTYGGPSPIGRQSEASLNRETVVTSLEFFEWTCRTSLSARHVAASLMAATLRSGARARDAAIVPRL